MKGKLSRFRGRFLFSMDNIHHLDKENHEDFLRFLNEVVSLGRVKVLFASNKYAPDCFSEGFSVKKIQKLKKHDSVDLFVKKIPLGDSDKKQFLEYSNIVSLHEVTVEKYGKESDVVPALCKMRH